MPIDIRKDLLPLEPPLIASIWKTCTPRLLVVTDSLSFGPDGFGLSGFVDALKSATIYGMTPEVRTAMHDPDPGAPIAYDAATGRITNFKFDDPTHGVTISRYDVVFVLGIDSTGIRDLTPGGLAALRAFMQAGGGLFCTGDHEDLGAAMSRDIPRIRSMRYWLQSETPDGSDHTRLTTIVPGADDAYAFDDQADAHPQRLYVNYRTVAGGLGNAHPLLQIPGATRAIEVFPDHPHEGECRLPDDLTTKIPGTDLDEWPAATGGGERVAPEIVAVTMSHGKGGYFGKQPVVPRSFVAICAYDGQAAGVGRAVTDATWHHFVNVNLTLTGRDLDDVRQYFRNLASWLMPSKRRRCLRFPLLITELRRLPLFEELRPTLLEKASPDELERLGEQVEDALRQRLTAAEARELVLDAAVDGLGAEGVGSLRRLGARPAPVSAERLGHAALGALTAGTLPLLRELATKRDDPHPQLDALATKATRLGARRLVELERKRLKELDRLLEGLPQP